jgi:extracellular elastinolytic metalloproteinase
MLLADTTVYQGQHHATIWKVFADRGMGFYAGSFGGGDSSPGADSHRPPASTETADITGTITDWQGAAVRGVVVRLAFQGSGKVNPSGVTDANGKYTITGVPLGTYPKIVAAPSDPRSRRGTVTVTETGGVRNFQLRP